MSVAIIAEYNPFHNGHKFQIEEAKKRWPNEKIIVFMSGDYVQRGEISILPIEERSTIAKKFGVDEVIIMPFEVSTQAAHIFCEGAIKMVNNHNIDKLFFGSESNDPELLLNIANSIYSDIDQYNLLIKKNLKGGNSFPKATCLALNELTGQSFEMPNDILGLEYCKAIVKHNFPINVYTLKRSIGFHDQETKDNFASASLIRKMIYDGEDVSQFIPYKIDYKNIRNIRSRYPEFQNIVRNSSPEELRNIKLISEGMENLFKKHIEAGSYNEFISLTNSKRYTSSRIQRVMLYVLLDVKK